MPGLDEDDQEPRLEDITRRSACDRCRQMKTRCERPSQRRNIAKLAQCTRCHQAGTKCVTTLEGLPERNTTREQNHAITQKSTRGERDTSRPLLGINTETQQLTARSQPRQQMDSMHPNPTTQNSPDSPAEEDAVALAGNGSGLGQWSNFSDLLDLNNTEPFTFDESAPMAFRQNSPDDSLLNNHFSTAAFPNSTLSWPIELPQAEMVPTSPQKKRKSHSERPSSPSTTSVRPSSRREVTRPFIDRLMRFNTTLSQALQLVQDAEQGSGATADMSIGDLFDKVLRNSDVLLQLLQSLRTNSSRLSTTDTDQNGRINSSVALQVLSCILTLEQMYTFLATTLTLYVAPEFGRRHEIQVLPALHIDGLQRLDPKAHVSVLTFLCAQMLVRVDEELEMLRQSGNLSSSASTTFKCLLTDHEEHGIENGTFRNKINRLVATLRQLAAGSSM